MWERDQDAIVLSIGGGPDRWGDHITNLNIETIRQWRKRFAASSLKKSLFKLQLVPRWLTSADFRLAVTSGVSANTVCFERRTAGPLPDVFEKAR